MRNWVLRKSHNLARFPIGIRGQPRLVGTGIVGGPPLVGTGEVGGPPLVGTGEVGGPPLVGTDQVGGPPLVGRGAYGGGLPGTLAGIRVRNRGGTRRYNLRPRLRG